ncbi:unnamed protein product [Caenorhabditis auriculariae]|uniref:Protein polybromo-1 n=1 Tax=Caenorhabditis auriculariae TaxID=2777116 RepID=A0A8S1GSF5_9PELO|nr:unnamed protein product [Caenorhabditis auriculariae]
MSTKRKRAADVESTATDSPLSTPSVKRKKGRMSKKEKEEQLADIQKGLAVLEVIRHHKGKEGRLVAEHFARAPSRRTDPEYYKVVSEPIDVTRIQQKLNTDEYRNFEQFCADVELLVKNARAYYKEDTEEYRDAAEIHQVFLESKVKAEKGELVWQDEDGNRATTSARGGDHEENERDRDTTASPEDLDLYMIEDILCGILEFTDSTGRLLCPPFRVLQSKEEFPLYYEKIQHPIDLKKIAEKAREGEYKKMDELEDDINLLFKNAQKFSGKGTEIFNDSEVLLKFVKDKVEQVLDKGCHPKRRDKVRRIVDGLLAQSPSAWASEEFSEDSEEDEDTENKDDPRWRLYWTIRNATNEKDHTSALADPFLELPNRSYYPDYYDEIKSPMSLFMINKKLKRGDYEFDQMFKDLMLIFANACEYNMDGSEVYTFAKKLEKIAVQSAKMLKGDLNVGDFEKKTAVSTPKKPKTPKAPKIKIEVDIGSESDTRTPPPASHKKRSPKKPNGDNGTYPGKPGRKSLNELMIRYRKKMLAIWEAVANEKVGRQGQESYWPASPFMELPSYREYPDYYDVIANPIDMKTIRERIETDKYDLFSDCVADFKRMFANARTYNVPKSRIYADANHLERVMAAAYEANKDGPQESPAAVRRKLALLKPKSPKKRRTQLKLNGGGGGGLAFGQGYSDDESSNSSIRSPEPTPKQTKKGKGGADKKFIEILNRLPIEEQKMWRLLHGVKDYRDEKGRMLSVAFMKLPTREEYPRYYDVIKKPMDLQRIQQRLNAQAYHTLSDLYADLTLMLDNACRYNEPESSIYKDAVSLQRLLLEMKREFGSDESLPRVQVEIRTIFTSIFAAVFSMKDKNERCLADSFVELPELLKAKGIPAEEWPFTFDQIKRNIDKSRYRRLDRLQKDFFDLFDKAREVSKIGSTLFNDAVELQKKFIEERDAKCKGVIFSNAYNVNQKDIDEAVESERSSRSSGRKSAETEEVEEKGNKSPKKLEGEVDLESFEKEGKTFKAPCFAYIARTDDKKLPPHIMRIERIFKNENGDEAVQGSWVYRPNETLHLASRKFFANEVFITPFFDTVLAERLIGQCTVVFVKTFVNNEIRGVEPNDVYACEWRYHGKPKYFLKIKQWEYADEDEKLDLLPRERPISPERTISEFAAAENEEGEEAEDTATQSSSTSSEEDSRLKSTFLLDIDRPEIKAKGTEEDADGRTYFQEMRSKTGRAYAQGQYVLVFNPLKPLCDIMRIDKLWREKDDTECFSGGWFARPADVAHDRGRMFYPKEVFAVNQPDQTRRVLDIQSRCDVMTTKDYIRQRPSEIPECDVFVCESRVQGSTFSEGETSSLFCRGTGAATGEEDYDTSDSPMSLDCAKNVRKFKRPGLAAAVLDRSFETEERQDDESVGLDSTPTPETCLLGWEGRGARLVRSGRDADRETSAAAATAANRRGQTRSSEGIGGHIHRRLLRRRPRRNFSAAAPAAASPLLFLPSSCQYKLHPIVPDDELFIFKTPIAMEKDMSPLLKNEGALPLDALDDLLDDDTDGSESVASANTAKTPIPTEPVASVSSPSPANLPNANTPHWTDSQPKLTVKSKSGYILFSAEIRKRIMHENPDAGFGEVSKIVGVEWKKLSDDQKRQYEVRAEYIATERAKQEAIKAAQERTLQPGQIRIYQCKWANCDSQFDAENGLYEHIVQHHTSQIIMDSDQQFVCMWVTCLRNRKDGKPFPSLPRLHRHMKEKHLTSSSRNVLPGQIGRNFYKLMTVTMANGEQCLQLVHAPMGRPQPSQQPANHPQQMNGNGMMHHHQQTQQHHPQQQHMIQQHHQQAQMNGHHHHPQMSNGEHHHPQYVRQGQPQQVHHQPQQQQQVMYTNSPSCSQYQQVPQPQQAGQMQVAQVTQVITDPGRTIVRAPQHAEPVFVAPPNSIHSRRVLHSEAYLKYIESLTTRPKTGGARWERSLAPSHKTNPHDPNNRNAAGGPHRLPTHWIRECRGRPVTREEDVTKALWRLRDELLQSTCNVDVNSLL